MLDLPTVSKPPTLIHTYIPLSWVPIPFEFGRRGTKEFHTSVAINSESGFIRVHQLAWDNIPNNLLAEAEESKAGSTEYKARVQDHHGYLDNVFDDILHPGASGAVPQQVEHHYDSRLLLHPIPQCLSPVCLDMDYP